MIFGARRDTRSPMRLRWYLIALVVAIGCRSPGPYGHARTYTPLDEEKRAVESAREYDPVMAQRSPDQWRGKPVSLFGVVTSRSAGPGGTADLALSLRRLEERNLCDSEDEDSCRVTVSDRQHGVVHVLAKLESNDDIGQLSVGPGSLLRVVGTIGDELAAADGAAVIRASYYRHWPRNYYVTSADRSHMRR
jgi:hypothetical protein